MVLRPEMTQHRSGNEPGTVQVDQLVGFVFRRENSYRVAYQRMAMAVRIQPRAMAVSAAIPSRSCMHFRRLESMGWSHRVWEGWIVASSRVRRSSRAPAMASSPSKAGSVMSPPCWARSSKVVRRSEHIGALSLIGSCSSLVIERSAEDGMGSSCKLLVVRQCKEVPAWPVVWCGAAENSAPHWGMLLRHC